MMFLNFTKMHGLLNDFVIIDMRHNLIPLDADRLAKIANRRAGVGCDQIIVLHLPQDNQNHVRVEIFNQDGSMVEMCGNAMRCVTALLTKELSQNTVRIETATRTLECTADKNLYTVNMGGFSFAPKDIGLTQNIAALSIAELNHPDLGTPDAISVGNPHLVFWASKEKIKAFQDVAASYEKHPLFLNKINVSIAEIINESAVKLLTFERGVGFTPACGSAACAAVALGFSLKKLSAEVKVHMEGGDLTISLCGGSILMTGPAKKAFSGTVDLNDL